MSATALPSGTTEVAFVGAAADASAPRPGTAVVVLDSAWTPGPGERPDLHPVRPALSEVVASRDLFDEALQRLDAWAQAAGLADRLLVEGTTYWFRFRETLWRALHERLLWTYALERLAIDAVAHASVPGDEAALIDMLAVHGIPTTVAPDAAAVVVPQAKGRGWLGRITRSAPAAAPRTGSTTGDLATREALLDARVRALAAADGPSVLALTMPGNYHRVGDIEADANLGSVLGALRRDGVHPILLALGLDQRDDADWARVKDLPRWLPMGIMRTRWSEPDDEARANRAVEAIGDALRAAARTPLEVGGRDLAGLLVDRLAPSLTGIVGIDVRQLARTERMLRELEPDAVLLTIEGVRTPWLMACAAAGIPVFAVQHGVLYPTHPGYAPVRHPTLALATRTFVYGDYERRVLTSMAYQEDEVEVSGSPRLDLDRAATEAVDRAAERASVRRELGVADTDRMLVVSTVNLPFVRRSHVVHMIERTLGGPLPGIHVVFKLHPGERDEGPYVALLDGLARAGGYDPPPMSVTREIDLYRLLRAADAHLGMHSTVLTDAVAAGTPNLIAMVDGKTDTLGYVPAGVARPVLEVGDVLAAISDPVPVQAEARRAFLDDHFRPGDAGTRIATSVLAAAARPTGALAR